MESRRPPSTRRSMRPAVHLRPSDGPRASERRWPPVSDAPETAGRRDARTPHPPETAADKQFDGLATARFNQIMARHPVYATFLGRSEHDDELADGSRDGMLEDAALAHRFLEAIEAIDPAQLSPYFAIERELALFATRREIFDIEEHRVWERRVSATDEIGDGLFLLMARGTRPLSERLISAAARLEQAPRYIERHKTRLDSVPPAKLWNEMELDAI